MNRLSHVLMVWYVRITPMLIALAMFLNLIFAHFELYQEEFGGKLILINARMFGLGYWLIIGLYISSITYKFCIYHRLFIHYILLNKLITVYDDIYNISERTYFIVLLAAAAVLVFLALYLYKKYGDRNLENTNHHEHKQCMCKCSGKDCHQPPRRQLEGNG